MKRYTGLLLIALLVLMGCTFSSKIATPTPPADVPPPAEPTAERPQTAFIDSRDPNANVIDETINAQNAEPIADSSASGYNGGAGASYDANTTYTTSGGYYTNAGYHQPHYYPLPQTCIDYSWTYVYTVRPGDNLSNIAARAGTTWQVLAQANCLANPNRIYVGQILRVPVPVNSGPYPPNPYPPNPQPPYPGVQSVGAVIPNPYVGGYNGQYQLQAGSTVTLVWAINPAGLTRVDFYYAGNVIGSDSYFADGVAITWVVPNPTNGYLTALGYNYGTLSKQTAQYTLVYTSNPNPVTPTPQPPVVVGSGLSISPFDSVSNNTFILPPDQLITFSWPATFPTATERVVFELVPPGGGTAQPMGVDTNLGDGASIIWNAVLGTQGTVRAVAYFTGGFAPQYSDTYYIIAGNP